MSFIINKLKERIDFIEKNAGNDKKELLTELHDTFSAMCSAGVDNEEDYRDFFYVMAYVPMIIKDIVGNVETEELAKIAHVVYGKREENPINTITNFYRAVEAAIKDIGPIKKMAYPQGTDQGFYQPPRQLEKWVQAMRGIYALKYKGLNQKQAIDKITEKWDTMEKRDFEHWLKFYEGGNHLSYKLAAESEKVYHDFGGAPVPIGSFPKARIPMGPQEDEPEEVQSKAEKKKTIRDLVQQIVARLTSAEKLYAFNDDFRKLLGTEHEAWLATLQQLKRKLQTAPIQNVATIEDLVIKYGNKLRINNGSKTDVALLYVSAIGLVDTNVMVKTAQGAPVAPPPVGEGGGDLELPPDMPDMGGAGGETDNDPDAAMNEFMENLGAKPDKNKEKEEKFEADDLVVSEEEYDLYKMAQEAPIPEVPPASDPIVPDSAITPTTKDGDEVIEEALKHITIKDIILKLEGLTQLYKNRPLARELTIVDLMMDAVGISSYFPNMAEATKSALDSNQYVLTRIEDILAKLRGASAAESGQLDILKQKLETAEDNDSEKRQQKEQANMTPGGPPAVPGAPGTVPPKVAPEEPPKANEAPELAAPVEVEAPKQPGVRV